MHKEHPCWGQSGHLKHRTLSLSFPWRLKSVLVDSAKRLDPTRGRSRKFAQLVRFGRLDLITPVDGGNYTFKMLGPLLTCARTFPGRNPEINAFAHDREIGGGNADL